MDFPTSIKTCFSKYATFEGRASRSEYWYFVLFQFIVSVAALLLDSAFNSSGIFWLLACLALALPLLSAQVRRLHDIGRSGWYALLSLLPLVGPIVLIVWSCKPSVKEQNDFGPPPSQMPAEPKAQQPESTPRNLDGLERLFAMHEKGILTKEEFEAQKAKLLG